MVITLRSYIRIHQVIRAIVESENGSPSHSCTFFSMIGAAILDHHFKIDAKVRSGLALYYLGEGDEVLCFGDKTEEGLTGAKDNFHCWIEADGWAIDFMAPVFSDLYNGNFKPPKRMFQKRIVEMANSVDGLSAPGDFFLHPAYERTEERLQKFWTYPAYSDLVNIAVQWFRKAPQKMQPNIHTSDGQGHFTKVALKPLKLTSKW